MRTIAVIACFALTCACWGQSLTPEQAAEQLKQLPPGSSIILERTHDGGNITVEEEATGTGAALQARGKEIVSTFNSTAPGATLGKDRGATGGDTETNNKVKGGDNLWANPLLWVGILCILGAGVAVYLRMFKAAMIAGLAGGCLIAAALAPMLFGFAIAAALLVVVVPYIHKEWHAKQLNAENQAIKTEAKVKDDTLRSVVAGVADFGKAAKDTTNPLITPDAYERLKSYISSHMLPEEAVVVREIKDKDRL